MRKANRQAISGSPAEPIRHPLPVVSLFSGAGGLDLGFMQSGFTPVLALDKEKAACLTYMYNHPAARVLKQDLATVRNGYILDRIAELPVSVKPVGLIGGPPCQAFSQGNRNGAADDPRADLPHSYAHILRELTKTFELDFFVFENVLGLKHRRHAELFKTFKRLFASAGYTIFEGELDAQDFGVAQVRKRLFVVGFNDKKYPNMDFFFPESNGKPTRTVRDVIEDLAKPAFFERDTNPEDLPVHPNHWCMRPRSRKFFNGYLKEGDLKGRPFRVLKWDKPSWTVAYGHREVHIHPDGRRRLSVYEAMILQGFPPQYRLWGTLSDQIRLVSDAVPPPVAKALSASIREVIEHGKQITRPQWALLPFGSKT
jgi:DNA (cytosine-5)-methyltransferase 1